MNIQPGNPYPLGALYNGNDVNFCLYADNASSVDLCLFKSVGDKKESHRLQMSQRTHSVWHSSLKDVKPG